MIEFIFYILFPWIGAFFIWIFCLGQKKYSDILEYNQELLAIVGGIIICLFIVLISYLF
jgi:hypothetical protein